MKESLSFFRFYSLWRALKAGRQTMRDVLSLLLAQKFPRDLTAEEKLLVRRALSLRTQAVSRIMVPHSDIFYLPISTPMAEACQKVLEEGHSRVPLVGQSLDRPLGMLHVKDLFKHYDHPEQTTLADILRPVLFIPPSARIAEVLLDMRKNRTHMALVIDEHGGTDGLVTIEDILEALVGEIQDEHDDEQPQLLVKIQHNAYLLQGTCPLPLIEEEMSVVFDEKDKEQNDTIGGLISSYINRIPVVGEVIEHPCGWNFEILQASLRQIRSLSATPRAARLAKAAESPPPAAPTAQKT